MVVEPGHLRRIAGQRHPRGDGRGIDARWQGQRDRGRLRQQVDAARPAAGSRRWRSRVPSASTSVGGAARRRLRAEAVDGHRHAATLHRHVVGADAEIGARLDRRARRRRARSRSPSSCAARRRHRSRRCVRARRRAASGGASVLPSSVLVAVLIGQWPAVTFHVVIVAGCGRVAGVIGDHAETVAASRPAPGSRPVPPRPARRSAS